MGYVLVTNDFPPKVGGIQSYLYELFRRLPPKSSRSSRPRTAEPRRSTVARPFG